MRAARFVVTTGLLAESLGLPEGARIIGVENFSLERGHLTLVVDDPALPEAAEPHSAEPTVTRVEHEWRWNIKA